MNRVPKAIFRPPHSGHRAGFPLREPRGVQLCRQLWQWTGLRGVRCFAIGLFVLVIFGEIRTEVVDPGL